jgi:transcriptional regulator with XRE-family HTH domain
MVGITPQQIRRFETGKSKIKIDILFDISLALRVSLTELIDEGTL